jgi:hypothetical protein
MHLPPDDLADVESAAPAASSASTIPICSPPSGHAYDHAGPVHIPADSCDADAREERREAARRRRRALATREE